MSWINMKILPFATNKKILKENKDLLEPLVKKVFLRRVEGTQHKGDDGEIFIFTD